jgi:hypothetical protein
LDRRCHKACKWELEESKLGRSGIYICCGGWLAEVIKKPKVEEDKEEASHEKGVAEEGKLGQS